MSIFARIKRFCKRIKDAIKELIFGTPVPSSEVVNVEIVTETVTNPDGSTTIVKTEKVNPNGSWKDILKRAGNKIRDGIAYVIDNPSEAWKKVFGPGALIAIVSGTIIKASSAISTITSPFKKFKENRKKEYTIYDDTVHGWYTLKRPLTRSEKNAVYAAQARAGRGGMHQALLALGVLA